MYRIYLLDDHQVVREGLRALLQANGHVVVGDSGEPHAALLAMQTTCVDLLLLDIHLAGHSGLTVLQSMREAALKVPTLVLSMSDQPHHVMEALRLGVGGYILKGAAGKTLLSAVDAVASGGCFLEESLRAMVASSRANTGQNESPVSNLSKRELQILGLVVRGSTSAAIAAQLGLSSKTVDTYRSRLMTKLDTPDVTALVRFAIRWDIIGLEQ